MGRFNLALPVFIGFISGFPRFYLVLPGFTWFYWVLPGFTGFYRVLGYVGYDQVTSRWNRMNWALLGFYWVSCGWSDGNSVKLGKVVLRHGVSPVLAGKRID